MPHSISNAAAPETNGVAIEVPLFTESPPPTAADIISTPGATISGLIWFVSLVNPLPEKSAYVCLLLSYAPTVIALEAVDGIVNVV